MTLKQIEKTRSLLSKIDSANGLREMQELASEVSAFYGDDFKTKLKITSWNTPDTYSQVYEKNDKIAIQNFLESLIAQDINAPAIIDILDYIEEGEQAKKNKKLREKYVSKVFYSYSDKISFDKMTETIAMAPQEVLNFNMYQVTEEMIDGIITKLKSYANILIKPKPLAKDSNSSVQNKQEINFQPHINIETKNETRLNEKFQVQITKECLDEQLYKLLVLQNLREIKRRIEDIVFAEFFDVYRTDGTDEE